MNALPIIIGALCLIAISYRYYSAFIAAKVLALDDSRPVPSQTMYDGHNYYPTNKWVLFGHHFAAISGAGPLIGPVLAAHTTDHDHEVVHGAADTNADHEPQQSRQETKLRCKNGSD